VCGEAPFLEAGWHVRNWLPSGVVGKLLANDMKLRTNQVSARIREYIDAPVLKRERRVIQMAVGTTRIEGELRPLVGGGILHFRPSRVKRDQKPEAHLSLWIEHLLWQLVAENGSKESCLIGEDGRWVYAGEPKAMELLESLVEVYWRGQERPLRFFPRSSFASVEGRSGSPKDRALKQWESSEFDNFGQGESEDPYMNLCFRNDPDPLGEEFLELSLEVFEPMVANCGKAS
jgi:exonuclease V gamma subunit